MTPFTMGTTSSTTMQSLGKIAQCAPAVGAKIWCLFFVCLFVCLLVTLRVRSTVRSRGAYLELALRCRLLSDFDVVCSVFFGSDCSFRNTIQFSFSWLGGATIFLEIVVKNCGNPKNRRKRLCAPLHTDSRGLWKNSTTVVYGRRDCRCAPA